MADETTIFRKPTGDSLRTAAAYPLAGGVLVVAVLIRYALDPWMGNSLPLVTLFGAVATAVWIGGLAPATIVAVLGYVAVDYLFIPPRGQFGGAGLPGLIGILAYLFTCALILTFGEAARRAQSRANERRELLRVTLLSIGDAVITTDVQGRISSMNAVAENLTGWPEAEALRRPLDDVFRIVNEQTRNGVASPALRALAEGIVVGLANHTLLIRRNGEECAIDDSAAPIKDERGRVSGAVLIFRDVSEQRRHEREQNRQLLTARTLAAIVESSDDGIISKSLDGIIESWNAAAERMFGYTADQAIGRHISLIIPPDRLAEEDQIIASLRAGTRVDHFETERVRADGTHLHVSLTISPIRNASGVVVGASKIVRDVTDRRRADTERQMMATVVENSTDFIGICDLEGIPFFVNRAGLALVGLTDMDQARRTPLQAFFFPEDQPRVMEEFLPAVLERGHAEMEVRFRHFKTGQARWMAYKVIALPDATGAPVAFATVSQDITERKQLADSLRSLASELSEADRRKNEFLAMLAHELRNPLAPISNAARALRLGVSDPDAIRSAADMLERQIGQMSRLVDDLLDMSRITRGKIELRKGRVELAPVVQQAIEAARPHYRDLDQELAVSLPAEPLFVDADAVRLAQVVGNLLNNASKFTERGGQVGLTLDAQDGEAVIRVRDSGVGIAAEDLARVFDMFAQVDTSLERSQGGLGIGLTLVKTLVEMHGGSVEARSEGIGRGSEFVVRLPLMAEAAAAPPAARGVPPASTVAHRVLVVDDSIDGAESLAMLLELAGHQTWQAHGGLQAIETAARVRPDVVLLDIGLPQMSGYEVCRRIRQEPWGKPIVIVALTGWGQDEARAQSREAGFDAHMVKPVDYDALLKYIAALPSEGSAASSVS